MNKMLTTLFALQLLLLAPLANACAGHIYINPDNYGFLGRTAIKLAGLAPPEPVFKIKHVPMVKAPLGTEQELVVEYERPWFSDDVSVLLTSTAGVKIHENIVELEDYKGTVNIRFSLEKNGYNSISLKVSGKHKGEIVNHSSIVYIRAKKTEPAESMQVSAR